MLRANPENPKTDPIIQELKTQCETLQKNIHSRLMSESNQKKLDELLKVNDLFNELQTLYKDVIAGKKIAPPPSRTPETKTTGEVDSDKKQDGTLTSPRHKKKKKKKKKRTSQTKAKPKPADAPAAKNAAPVDLLGLMDDTPAAPGGAPAPAPAAGDLLDSIFGDGKSTEAPAGPAPEVQKQKPVLSDFNDDAFMALARKRAE
mmetsp:Transcript_9590/g.18755  ORF Transcript_9590/g.18755 Transcript_9590/m.18755 type:complete len:203 (+) Transcript_9590:329-937(+)